MNQLKDKVVVITGAGSGLGQALAKAFVNHDAKVIGLGRSEDKLKATKNEIDSVNFKYFVVDASNFDNLQRVVTKIVDEFHTIDFLYNNAAVYPKVNFLNESAADFAAAIGCNVNGVANCCKTILPIMLEKNSGRIFNLGSWADIAPIENSAAYSASKGAVRALTKAISADLASKQSKVQIHEWIPGHLNTQMSDYTGIDPAVSAAWGIALAIRHIDKPSTIFDRDQEVLPPRSLKQKIKEKLRFWKK